MRKPYHRLSPEDRAALRADLKRLMLTAIKHRAMLAELGAKYNLEPTSVYYNMRQCLGELGFRNRREYMSAEALK